MAKIRSSDLMLLSREGLTAGSDRSIFKYSGDDFRDSVVGIVSDLDLDSQYVNLSGDTMDGTLYIDVNKSLINPENELCLDIAGKAEVRQLVLNPTNNDAAHISLFLKGERNHQVFFQNAMELVARYGDADVGTDVDKRIVQIETPDLLDPDDYGTTHVSTNITVGLSAAAPRVTIAVEGESAFGDRILIGNIEEDDTFKYNNAAHKGYVDSEVEELRTEVLGYVEVDIQNDYTFRNINKNDITEIENKEYIASSNSPNSGEMLFEYEDATTEWVKLESVTLAKDSYNTGPLNWERIEEGTVLRIGYVSDDYIAATYEVTGIEDIDSAKVKFTVNWQSTNIVNGSPAPEVTVGQVYGVHFDKETEVGSLLDGDFYWEIPENTVDENNTPINDWRGVNRLIVSKKTTTGTNVSASFFPEGADLSINTIEVDSIFNINFKITNSYQTQIVEIHPINYSPVIKQVIAIEVEPDTLGDVTFSPERNHTFVVAQSENIKKYVDDKVAIQADRNDIQDDQIAELQQNVRDLENAEEKGTMKFGYQTGHAGPGFFTLNDINQQPQNKFDTSVHEIFLSNSDVANAPREWAPGGDEFDPTNKIIVLTEKMAEGATGSAIRGEYQLTGFTVETHYTKFNVDLSAGDVRGIDVNTEFDVKIQNLNEGISSSEAYSVFCKKVGGDILSGGKYRFNDNSGVTGIVIDPPNSTMTLGNTVGNINGTLIFEGADSNITHGTTLLATLNATEGWAFYKELYMSGQPITSLPTPDESQEDHAANVEFVKDYVEEQGNLRVASNSRLGGIKVDQNLLMSDEHLHITHARVIDPTQVKLNNVGVASFDENTFTHNSVEYDHHGTTRTARCIIANKDPDEVKYGMIKLSNSCLRLNDDKQLYLKINDASININSDNELYLRTATDVIKGGVKLLDSKSSNKDTTSGTAATPKSVKLAYDKGVEALNAAKDAQDAADDAAAKAEELSNSAKFQVGDPVAATSSNDAKSKGFYWYNNALYFKP